MPATASGPIVPIAQDLSTVFPFNDQATTEIYTLSLHDALPICKKGSCDYISQSDAEAILGTPVGPKRDDRLDRKSTRLNSSHTVISYAVFCLKKKSRRCRCMHPRDGGLKGGHAEPLRGNRPLDP